jgi:NAD(P)-dependent dehydrogenase (short-subunit alcohol dehydrogenase family)
LADALFLADKVVIVTGASGGIGRAAAVAFAERGARVVVAGRRESEHEETVRLVEKAGGKALFVRTDVTKAGDVDRLVGRTLEAFSGLHCAFNNAGIFGKFCPLTQDSEDNWHEVIDTNLKGVWLCMRRQIAAMLEFGGGSVVNCSSVSGVLGHIRSAAYSASKHGVIGLSKSVALQYARKGIRVNVVCPGSTDTEMLRAVYATPEELAARSDMLPIGRFGSPREVAEAAVWLCSDASSFVTGQVLGVDGGVTAGRGEKR